MADPYRRLSIAERLELVGDIWDSIAEAADAARLPLSEEDNAFDRIIVREGNLLDVNWRELEHAFPGHRMFEKGRLPCP